MHAVLEIGGRRDGGFLLLLHAAKHFAGFNGLVSLKIRCVDLDSISVERRFQLTIENKEFQNSRFRKARVALLQKVACSTSPRSAREDGDHH